MIKKGFNAELFYEDLERKVRLKEISWRQLGQLTGVSPSTLTRMAQGRTPDAASLAALSAWAGINPAAYVDGGLVITDGTDTLKEVSVLFRKDPSLEPEARRHLESIIEAAYKSLRSQDSHKDSEEK